MLRFVCLAGAWWGLPCLSVHRSVWCLCRRLGLAAAVRRCWVLGAACTAFTCWCASRSLDGPGRPEKGSAHPCRPEGVLRAEGRGQPLHQPHPIRLAAQAGQIIFAPSDSASALSPLHELLSYQRRFSISREDRPSPPSFLHPKPQPVFLPHPARDRPGAWVQVPGQGCPRRI